MQKISFHLYKFVMGITYGTYKIKQKLHKTLAGNVTIRTVNYLLPWPCLLSVTDVWDQNTQADTCDQVLSSSPATCTDPRKGINSRTVLFYPLRLLSKTLNTTSKKSTQPIHLLSHLGAQNTLASSYSFSQLHLVWSCTCGVL